ncbi:unnamed protein product, partial [marine sediment metagenome]
TALAEYPKAFADFAKAIQLNPKYANAYYNRGIAYGELRQHTKAVSDYTRAIELDPKYTEAYYNRGVQYVHLRK